MLFTQVVVEQGMQYTTLMSVDPLTLTQQRYHGVDVSFRIAYRNIVGTL